MHVIVAGNPFDGLQIHGPFEDAEEAGDWAEHGITDEWWIVQIHPVEAGG